MKTALIGAGLMGEPTAKRLFEAGTKLIVYNRTKSKPQKLEQLGIEVTGDPSEAINSSDIIILILTDYSAICDVLFSKASPNYKNKIFIQMSTIAPDESILLNERIENAGGQYLESPVLGSVAQVQAGKLIIMVNGSEDVFNQVKYLLEKLGEKLIYFGEFGKASACKLALNQLIASLTTAFSMSLGYLREKAVDVDLFMDILTNSALHSPTFEKKLSNYLSRDFSNPNFPVKHLLKDVKLILREFELNNINSDSLKSVKNILMESIEQRLSELDYSAIYNVIHPEKK